MIVLFGFLGLFCLNLYYIYVLLFKNKNKKKNLNCKSSSRNGTEFSCIDLLISEQVRSIHLPSTNTVTFYEGDIPTDIIVNRLQLVLEANPWLGSRLVSYSENGSKIITAKFPQLFQKGTLGEYYEEVHMDNSCLPSSEKIDENASPETILPAVERYLVKLGRNCLNQENEVMFKILILRISDFTSESGLQKKEVVRTAFVLSLSHVLADGHTYYSLFSMFDPKKPVFPLITKRCQDFPERLNQITGSDIQEFSRSYFLLFSSILYQFLFKPKMKVFCFKINSQEISKLKKESLESTPERSSSTSSFISTNDILASWFFNEMKPDIAMVPVNYRNRFPGYSNQHAGNYQSNILFHEETYATPFTVRECVAASTTDLVPYMKLPTTWETLKFQLSMFTNWSGFYHDIHFHHDGNGKNRLLVHLPLLSTRGISLPSVMVLFRPRDGELAAYIICDAEMEEEEWLRRGSFLEKFSS
jgi:hypothetical protein